jgi:Spy/CpxP family protein refolding chaperone
MRIGTKVLPTCFFATIGLIVAGADSPPMPKKDIAAVRTAIWQLPDERIGVRTAPILLLSRDDVATDLNLTQDQRAKTWDMIAELGRQAAELKGRSDKDALVLRRKIDQAQLEWLNRELTPEQNARLNQIDLQWEGPSALVTRPQISQTVHLTEAQKTKIREILGAAGKSALPTDLARRETVIRQVFRELDETQQQTWRALIGPDFFVVPRTASAR